MERHFSPKDQKVIVRYLNFLKYDPKEIYEIISAACGLHVADYQIVKNWLEKINGGEVEGDDDEEDGSPEREAVSIQLGEHTSHADPEAVARIEELISRDRRLPIEKIMEMSMTTEEVAYDIVHDDLGLKRISERWVPRLWTPEQRSYRVEVAKQLVDRFDNEGEDFLMKIIVGDESFIHYYTPTNSQQRAGMALQKSKYIPSIEPVPVRYIFFYDRQGILCFEHIPENTAVNAKFYSDFLRNKLVTALQTKRKDVDIKNLSLIHGNSASHNSLIIKKTLDDIELDCLPNPPASPDMEPYEYFLFNYLNNHLKEAKFSSVEEVTKAIQRHLDALKQEDFENCFKKLIERWESIMDSRGLYVH